MSRAADTSPNTGRWSCSFWRTYDQSTI